MYLSLTYKQTQTYKNTSDKVGNNKLNRVQNWTEITIVW